MLYIAQSPKRHKTDTILRLPTIEADKIKLDDKILVLKIILKTIQTVYSFIPEQNEKDAEDYSITEGLSIRSSLGVYTMADRLEESQLYIIDQSAIITVRTGVINWGLAAAVFQQPKSSLFIRRRHCTHKHVTCIRHIMMIRTCNIDTRHMSYCHQAVMVEPHGRRRNYHLMRWQFYSSNLLSNVCNTLSDYKLGLRNFLSTKKQEKQRLLRQTVSLQFVAIDIFKPLLNTKIAKSWSW